jgi:hypothetical protein
MSGDASRRQPYVPPEIPWSSVSRIGVILLVILAFCFGADAGITWDEQFQSRYGDMILAWFASGFTDGRALYFADLYVYGGLFDTIAQLIVKISPLGVFETRHVLTTLLGVVGVCLTGLTARRIAGPRAGFMAGLFLATMPAWIGHSLFNPKDLPFAVAGAGVIYVSVRIGLGRFPTPTSELLLAGIAIGTALAIRAGGVFMLAYPLIAMGARYAVGARGRDRTGQWRLIDATLHRFVVVPLVAWAVMITPWPWGQSSPLNHPLMAIRASSEFEWKGGQTLFSGQLVDGDRVPLSYLPTWFWITTPECVGLALAFGIIALVAARPPVRRDSLIGLITVVGALVLPAAAVVITRPTLYDGIRHFLFVLPLIAVLAGLSFSFLLGSMTYVWFRIFAASTIVLSLLLTLSDIVQLHPYEYVYFNRVYGRLPAAVNYYETDYWGASYKEGLAWVVEHLDSISSSVPLRVAGCDEYTARRLEYYRDEWGLAGRVVIVRGYAQADVFLANPRFNCHKVPGSVIHTVERQQAPLMYVIKTVR